MCVVGRGVVTLSLPHYVFSNRNVMAVSEVAYRNFVIV